MYPKFCTCKYGGWYVEKKMLKDIERKIKMSTSDFTGTKQKC